MTYNDCMQLAWMVMVVEQLTRMASCYLMTMYVEVKLERKKIHAVLVLAVPQLQIVLVASLHIVHQRALD